MTSEPGPSTSSSMPVAAISVSGLSSDVTGAIGTDDDPVTGPSGDASRRRRISYFMLFRLAVLTVFTGLASLVAYSRDGPGVANTGFVVATLVVGFALTIFFARQLPRVEDLHRFAWLQTTTDIVLAAAVVGMTGGADSGFQWLFLIAVLGAATMGGQRMTWAASGACLLVVIAVGTLQWTGVFAPSLLGEPLPKLSGVVLWSAVGRTTAALLGVTILSSYLGRQLSTSVSQVGELRVLNENIVRSLSSGLVSLDTSGCIQYFNPAAAQVLRLSGDFTGTPIEAVLPGLRAAQGDGNDRVELTVPVAGGAEVHLGLSQVPLRDGSGERIGDLINFTDLTRIKELTQQVRRHERLAALGGLAASVAHEIRNPLTAIAGSAELLGATPNLDPQDTRLLAVIQRESSRLDTLITDLLAFTRPKPPQRVKLSLATTVREISEAFAADPLNDDVDISLRVIEDVPVFVDPAQISQVLWNLIRNAAEAMDARGRIDIELSADKDGCLVVLTDSGAGIPEERLGRIFDPFFTTKETGTGFGLAIVHRVVQDNGGSIDVASPPGSGARFEIRFAAADPNRAEVSGVLSVGPPPGTPPP